MKAKIVIELNYDLADLRFMVGEDFPEEQFQERVEEQATHDLWEYLRTESVSTFGRLEITEWP